MVEVPQNVVLTSASTDTVRVTIRDKGWMLWAYIYGNKMGNLNVAFKNHTRNGKTGIAVVNDIRRLVEQKLEISSKVVSIKPEKLEFYYNNGECKRVPVRWAGRVLPDPLYFISQVEYKPDSVDVYASKEQLDSIKAIYTEQLNHINFRDTLTVDCHLSHSRRIKVEPDKVRIRFLTDVLTEETIAGVPILCNNMPEGKVLRTFPAKIKVHFVAGVSHIRHLNPEDFIVVADYNEIIQNRSEKCNIYLQSVPHGVNRATLDMKQVDYLIEEE